MPKSSLVADEDFAWAERVSIRVAGRRVGDPLPGRGLYQFSKHVRKSMSGTHAISGFPREARHDIYGQAVLSGVAG
jgi:hypothetical protein